MVQWKIDNPINMDEKKGQPHFRNLHIPHMLLVWNIYLHLGHFWGKC